MVVIDQSQVVKSTMPFLTMYFLVHDTRITVENRYRIVAGNAWKIPLISSLGRNECKAMFTEIFHKMKLIIFADNL